MARREVEVLRSVQLIVAVADPAGDVGPTRRERAIRRRHEILEYLRLQGGEVRDPAGLVTRHLRVALGAGPELSHLLRALEHEGRILREVHGRRTYAIRLSGTAPSTDAHADAAAPLDATPDFSTFALAIVEMLDKRRAVADPDDRARVERLERERTAMCRDLAAYRAIVAAGSDPDAVRLFCKRTLESMVGRAVDFEHRTGIDIDDVFTAAEHERLLRLVQFAVTQPV